MSSEYHSTSDECTKGTLDLDDTTFWTTGSWPSDQLAQTSQPCFDDGMPRSMQRDLAEIDLALANDGAFGPSITNPMDGALPTFNFDYHFSSVNMARTTSDTSGYRSSHTPHQLRHTSYDNINRKRNFHQTDMGLSQSYSHSPATWLSTHVATSTHQPRIDEVQVYEPGDYCSKLANEAGAMQYATKKQRVNGFDENQPFPWSSTYAPDMCVPLAHNVAPSANMATSKSTHLSPCSLTSSEPLSRQSSVSSASVTDAFDMMRVESSFSTASDLFPLDPIDGSFVSCVTEKPASRQSTTGLNDGSASHSLSVMGYVGTDAFSFYSHDLSAGVAVCGQQNWSQAEGAPMASEKRASNNDLIELKASERRRKHIDNSRQCIAPKRSSDVRAGRSSKPRNASGGSHLQHGPTTSISTSQIDPKPSTVKRDPAQLKEPISKTPYVRPQHPKLYCNMCEDSGGFRGEHELRRHWDREHAQRRKVWICLQPSIRTEWWPSKPLSSCKQCKQQKQYNVYYNAAAHLRRAHFCPRKRGRKAKGEERESRAGKAGGDWPPIDWLKANGWLKEIEVSSTTERSSPMETSLGSATPMVDEVPYTPSAEFSTQHDAFATSHLPTGDLAFATPTMQWQDTSYSVPMQETVSAPACFPSTDAMGLYIANGYTF